MSSVPCAASTPDDQAPPTDLFTRDPPLFTSLVSDSDRGPTLICINDIPIPSRAELYPSDRIQVNFMVTEAVDPGWSKVPYSNQNGKTVMGENPKLLAEWDTQENEEGKVVVDKSKIRCFAYLNKKGKQKDKGPRIDGTDPSINDGKRVDYVLQPGMVFRCMMKRSGAIGGSDKEKRDNFFPQDVDVIPAFSRVMVKFACKGWDKYVEGDVDPNGDEVTKSDLSACFRGYGCGIIQVRMAPGTVSSDRAFLFSQVPQSPEEMRRRQAQFCEANWAIRQSFQCENVPFVVHSPDSSAYCAYDPDTECFKVMQWDPASGDAIDVPRDVMLRACNATDVESANQLMDVCLAMSAVRFLCFTNDYRGRDKVHSRFTGCPVISAPAIMRCVDPRALGDAAGGDTPFKSGLSIETEAGQDQLLVTVSGKAAPVQGGSPEQPCPEMPLVCKGVQLERAHRVSVSGAKAGVIWSGYFNLARPVICTKGAGANAIANAENAIKFGRKRWGQQQQQQEGQAQEQGGKGKKGKQ